MRKLLIVGAVFLAVAACERRPAQPPEADAVEADDASERLSGFRHDLSQDVSGYYMPVMQVEVGSWRLRSVSVLPRDEMTSWEAGRRGETYGPVMLEFDDTNSPVGVNELGGEHHTVTARVLPEAYEVTDTRLRFRGRSPEVGLVTLDADLDCDELGLARRNLGASEGPVLTGTLTVGDRTFEGQQFRWWMGD